MHRATQFALACGRCHKVPVVGHQTIGKQWHLKSLDGFGEKIDEDPIIGIVKEKRGSHVSAV